MMENRIPASRAASSRENGRSEVSITGVVAIKITASGIAHTANLSHDLNISRGMKIRNKVITRTYRAKLSRGFVISRNVLSSHVL